MFDFKIADPAKTVTGMVRSTLQSDGVEYSITIGSSDCASASGYWAQIVTEDTQRIWPALAPFKGRCLVRSDVWRVSDGLVIYDEWTAW